MTRRDQFVWSTAAILSAVAAGFLLLEQLGVETGLRASMGGDVARELRWFGQYGQLACVVVCVALIWQLDITRRREVIQTLILSMLLTLCVATAGKHLAGRVRPGFADAGRFLGPSLERDASRESFPSGHTSSAVTMTVVLSFYYPRLRRLLWAMAVACGALRWIRDAHWLADVLAGAAIGFVIAHLILRARSVMPWNGDPSRAALGLGAVERIPERLKPI